MTVNALRQSDAIHQSAIALGIPLFPAGKYSVIVADPPWKYTLRDRDSSHRGRTPYPQMSNEDILNLPVGAIAAPDAYLFLWTTSNHMDLAGQCIERWGFTSKSIHVWRKITKRGTPHLGIGHYGRNCTEFLRVATRGKPGTFIRHGLTSAPTIFDAPRTVHSAKPECFWSVPDALLSAIGGKGVELFARSARPGWDYWGLEAPQTEVAA